ncbi:DUF5081 family protein [Listeria welshimeri]|uniref:DUF5081 family protein n=1 Tax=Listeria welshimeri TaxID=1643 RepID=UPI0018877DD3|nr:DUF5081 family protein [Listeria welshimeri]MBF2379443.1 DUF5081 family protein [Listeria welshimeri]MBF2573821.1 DUF5081 family protein [Listeria welshimeri]
MTDKDLLNAQELYYLLEFRGIDFLFGIPCEQPNGSVFSSLSEKGILSPKGEINQMTVHYVELLKKYTESVHYIHIQQYIFGMDKDGLCVLLKETDNQYELLVGDALLMMQTALQHPIMRFSAAKNYEKMTGHLSVELMKKDFASSYSSLLVECYNGQYQLESQLAIGYKEEKFYNLDKEYHLADITDINPFEWFIQQVPQVARTTKKIMEEINHE